ncbi:MAG: phosphoheptose isomerase [Cyclobacteriaceae bacterium]|jgi:mannose-6-phosphate isomerase|nr:phosphoheptose isomerase [Cyclobacteriaceae bacterium]
MKSSTVDLSGSRDSVFQSISEYLVKQGFVIASKDFNRPWGGFFVLDESQAQKFAEKYFPEVEFGSLKISAKLSPKILVVEPSKRLSWQYHYRRAEIWKLIAGTSGVAISETDEQGEVHQMKRGEIIRLKQGQRHRLVGLEGWGVVAEIWQHTDASNPSDESDIIRLQDDFGR